MVMCLGERGGRKGTHPTESEKIKIRGLPFELQKVQSPFPNSWESLYHILVHKVCLNEDKTGQEDVGEKEMLIQAEHRVGDREVLWTTYKKNTSIQLPELHRQILACVKYSGVHWSAQIWEGSWSCCYIEWPTRPQASPFSELTPQVTDFEADLHRR